MDVSLSRRIGWSANEPSDVDVEPFLGISIQLKIELLDCMWEKNNWRRSAYRAVAHLDNDGFSDTSERTVWECHKNSRAALWLILACAVSVFGFVRWEFAWRTKNTSSHNEWECTVIRVESIRVQRRRLKEAKIASLRDTRGINLSFLLANFSRYLFWLIDGRLSSHKCASSSGDERYLMRIEQKRRYFRPFLGKMRSCWDLIKWFMCSWKIEFNYYFLHSPSSFSQKTTITRTQDILKRMHTVNEGNCS